MNAYNKGFKDGIEARTLKEIHPATVKTFKNFHFIRTKPDGKDILRYEANFNDTLEEIAKSFNEWDNHKSDIYEDKLELVTASGAQIQEPIKTGDRIYIRTKKKIQQPTNIAIQTQETKKEQGKTFALLINNDTEKRHIKNLDDAYNVLRNKNIDPCNIYVVSNSNVNDECRDRTIASNEIGVIDAFEEINNSSSKQDTLLIYFTGHGDKNPDWLNPISFKKLRKLSEGIDRKLVIAISDICYGGQVVDEFGKSRGKTLSLSPVASGEELICNHFSPYFWEAISKNKLDHDKNGETSLLEAFVWANLHRTIYESNTSNDIPIETKTREIAPTALEDIKAGIGSLSAVLPQIFRGTSGVYDATILGRIIKAKPIQHNTQKIVTINSNNYANEIVRSDIPVVLDIYAKWCGVCKILDSDLQRVLPQYIDRIKFAKIDYEAQGNNRVIEMYNPTSVTGYPTILFIEHGKTIKVKEGYGKLQDLIEDIDNTFQLSK